MEFISPEGLRRDGRRPLELRQLNAKVGVVDKANGSAIFEMGNTRVMVAVYGPHEVQMKGQQVHDHALVRCECSMANFSAGDRLRHFKGDRKSTEMAIFIRQTMEAIILTHQLPRSQIDIFVQVLQSEGGTRSTCINATILALADAGVPMKDLVASCTAGYLNSTPILDLNYEEEVGGGPIVTVGVMARTNKITLLQMDSKLHKDKLERVFQLALDGCKAVINHIQSVLLENTVQLEYQKGLKL